ncbi:MAG: response regulator [Azoarcus sp.]|nr:response regulator [Azoarcus sp.]
MAKLLIVDDEIGIRELLSEILRDEGHDVLLAENAAVARAARNAACPDMVLLDIWMPDTDGISLLKEWATAGQLTMPVVMMSGHGTIDTAVEATRIGAIDYLEKPIALQKLLATVKNGLQRRPVSVPPQLTLASLPKSAALADLHQRLRQVAMQSRIILFQVGADHLVELAARSLQTPGAPWLDLGTFTGSIDTAQLTSLHGGLLYLARLEKLTRAQQKNLTFIIDRLDRYNLRLIVVSGASRQQLLAAGWDSVLVTRLFAVALTAPGLADIRSDLTDLIALILRHQVTIQEVPPRRFSPAALAQLSARDWAGGYGELYATVRNLALATDEEEIVLAETAAPPSPALVLAAAETTTHPTSPPSDSISIPCNQPLREAREAFERMYFEYHLKQENGNMTHLAQQTGLERTHLYRKLKQLGLHGGRRGKTET